MSSRCKVLLALCFCVSTVQGHGFLARPVSRNAVGMSSNGYCTWSGNVPCFGDVMSLGGTDGPDATGCTNSGGRGGVTGGSGLSFGNTGVITSYSKGSIIDVEVDITAYHGGKFEFRVQDVGSSNDPDGSEWATITPLPVLSMSPECGTACPVKEPCAPGSNGAGTCAQIPLTKGDHNGHYNIRVQLPSDLQCEHCVMQWHWTSSNSCPGGLACSASEQFWNCADIRITADGSGLAPDTPTVGGPPDASNPSADDCNDFTARCQNACAIQSGGVNANQCFGSPVYTQCVCSDGSVFEFAGFDCLHSDCPKCGGPSAATPTKNPTKNPTKAPTIIPSGSTDNGDSTTPAPTPTPRPGNVCPPTGITGYEPEEGGICVDGIKARCVNGSHQKGGSWMTCNTRARALRGSE